MSYIYIISWWTVQPTAMNHVSYLIHRRVKEKKDSPNAEEVGRPMGSCTPQNSSMSESAVYDDQWKRWKLAYQYEIVHKAADIMCTCQYCGCNMCPMVARGGNINMVQTMWNNNVSCDQEVASSTDIEYIRPIQEHALLFLSLFVEAFTKIPHWKFLCFSQFDWLVGIGHLLEGRMGKKQNRREVGWAGRLAQGPRQQQTKWRAPGAMPGKNRSGAQGWGCAYKQVKQLISKMSNTGIVDEVGCGAPWMCMTKALERGISLNFAIWGKHWETPVTDFVIYWILQQMVFFAPKTQFLGQFS